MSDFDFPTYRKELLAKKPISSIDCLVPPAHVITEELLNQLISRLSSIWQISAKRYINAHKTQDCSIVASKLHFDNYTGRYWFSLACLCKPFLISGIPQGCHCVTDNPTVLPLGVMSDNENPFLR